MRLLVLVLMQCMTQITGLVIPIIFFNNQSIELLMAQDDMDENWTINTTSEEYTPP